MSKIETIKNVNSIALLFVSQANGMAQLSDQLIISLAQAELAGIDINTVWASIAETNDWADREAGLDGTPMPKTLANYRSMSRKAIALDVGHQFSNHADWKKAISAASKLANSASEESTPKIEAINLNDIELPSWIERASGIRSGMTAENIAAFDKYIHHHIEAFLQKKGK